MFLRRVAQHYNEAGWTVEFSPALEGGPRPFRPDLIVKRRQVHQAILVRDEPPGPFELASFGAQCKQYGLRGAVVCPDDARVIELCDQAGLEFVAAEGIGEVAVMGEAPPPPPLAMPREPEPVIVERSPVAELIRRQQRHIPWWRWAIVAAIWLAALGVLAYDVVRLLGI